MVMGLGSFSTRVAVIFVWCRAQMKIRSILDELGPFGVLVVQVISPYS